jgi:hypothetical protein
MVARAYWMVGSRFKYLCSDEEKKTVFEIEEAVRRQWCNTSKVDIFQEVKAWVEDPQYSRTRETK